MNSLRLSLPGLGRLSWRLMAVMIVSVVSLSAQTAPVITTQPPALVVVNAGETATMSVVATGTAPLSYQWTVNGAPIAGATNDTLVITNVRNYDDIGSYKVAVTNSYGSVVSTACLLRVNFPPFIYTQPDSQVAIVGSSVAFRTVGIGWPIPTVQWYHNGVAITGATDFSLQLTNVTSADAGDYNCRYTNSFGTDTSSVATLTVTSGTIVTGGPANANITAGATAIFQVYATGSLITYQWQEQAGTGTPWVNLSESSRYSGTGSSALQINNAPFELNDRRYRCVVTNTTGTEPSPAATLTVQSLAPYHGGYFGDFDTGGGHWAFYLRGTSATFLAYLPDRHSVIVVPLQIGPSGVFNATSTERLAGDLRSTGSGASFTLSGQIIGTAAEPSRRTVTGTLTGLGKTLTGEFRAGNGSLTLASGDFYTALALKGDQGRVHAVVGFGGDTLAVVMTPTAAEGIVGKLAFTSPTVASTTGITPSGASLGVAVNLVDFSLAATYSLGSDGTRKVSFLGLGEATAPTSKLTNVSVRVRGGAGDQTLIVGYVVSGSGTKPMLVRAIGPSLASYGVTGVQANPQLRIFNPAGAIIDENDDWGGGPALRTLFQSVGAFALDGNSLDAALAVSLTGGAYTAHASASKWAVGGSGAEGVSLVEVYDVDTVRTTRLINVSARAKVATGADTMIAGFVVTGNAPLTLLIRGVGPGLAGYGVAGALADPRLQVHDSTGAVLAENDNWGGGVALTSAFGQAGAFGLGATSKDAALIVTLTPGVYTAQVSSADGTAGLALVEVYELPWDRGF